MLLVSRVLCSAFPCRHHVRKYRGLSLSACAIREISRAMSSVPLLGVTAMYRTPAFRSASFLSSISRCSSSLVVAVSLVLNRRNRIATAGDYEEVGRACC